MRAALLFVCLTSLGLPARAQDAVGVPLSLERLSDRVVVVECLDVRVAAIATRRGLVVIETNRSPRLMGVVLSAIEGVLGHQDVAYVVHTHDHSDHTGGDALFPQAVIVAHQGCATALGKRPPRSAARLWYERRLLDAQRDALSQAGAKAPDAARRRAELAPRAQLLVDLEAGLPPIVPTMTFEDSLTLDLGDVTLELSFAGTNHSLGDILVYVPQEKLLFTGDLFCSPVACCFPIDALSDVPRLAARITRILGARAGLQWVIPGHGSFLQPADLVAIRDRALERWAALGSKPAAAQRLQQLAAQQGLPAAVAAMQTLEAAAGGTAPFSDQELAALGRRFFALGRPDLALPFLRLAVASHPTSALLSNSLAGLYLDTGQLDSAAVHYQRSLALAPTNPQAAALLEWLEVHR